MSFDELVSKWHQENLMSGPLSVDAEASAQVWDATLALRKSGAKDIDKWFTDNFMNKPPLSHNTPAVNQLRAAIADLKARIGPTHVDVVLTSVGGQGFTGSTGATGASKE
jgi:hypothetical protein